MLGKVIGFGRTAEIREWGDGRVVKLFHPGFPQAAIEREASAAALAHSLGVPTPALFQTVEVDGRLGIVFQRVSGTTMLQDLARRPWMLLSHAYGLARLQAHLHQMEGSGLPDLRERLARRIERSSVLTPAEKAAIVRRLGDLPDGDALCHGDLHPDNVVLTRSGPVLIDWMNAACGHPAADAARTAITLRLSLPPEGQMSAWVALGRCLFYRLYLRHYLRIGPASACQLLAWELPVAADRACEGLPRKEVQALYALVASRPDKTPQGPEALPPAG
ncbi:MAG: phosphotransferase [Anaerolineae bacterium]|nr:phosphotransferase [Anaerolineae bacterium]